MTRLPSLHDLAQRVGLNLAAALSIVDGRQRDHFAAPALLHAYQGSVTLPGPSTPAAFDLGLRLRAYRGDGITTRSVHAPVLPGRDDTVVALHRNHAGWEVNYGPDTRRTTSARGLIEALIPAEGSATLVVARSNVLHDAIELVGSESPSTTRTTVLWRLIQWRNGLERDGVGRAVNILGLLRASYATDRPEREDDLAHWVNLLGATSGASAIAELYRHLRPKMLHLNPKDAVAYANAWHTNLSAPRSLDESWLAKAASVTSRQAWTTWLGAHRAKVDPAYAASQQWTGRVLNGPLREVTNGKVAVEGRVPHYLPGAVVTVDLAGQSVKATVAAVAPRARGGVLVTLHAPGNRNVSASLTSAAFAGHPVVVRPIVPPLPRILDAGNDTSTRIAASDRSFWLSDPEKVPAARDVPWDVLLAAATD